jgi:hypothetical protein
VDAVIQPEFEAGLAMVQEALVQYNANVAAASQLMADLRKEFYYRVPRSDI